MLLLRKPPLRDTVPWLALRDSQPAHLVLAAHSLVIVIAATVHHATPFSVVDEGCLSRAVEPNLCGGPQVVDGVPHLLIRRQVRSRARLN